MLSKGDWVPQNAIESHEYVASIISCFFRPFHVALILRETRKGGRFSRLALRQSRAGKMLSRLSHPKVDFSISHLNIPKTAS